MPSFKRLVEVGADDNCHDERDSPDPLPPEPPPDTEIAIAGSVGQNGANQKPDVLTIQNALSGLSPAQGGPAQKLKVDGASGPFTIKAILDFQKFHRLPNPDGRVDPGRATIAKLNEVHRTAPPVFDTVGAGRRGGIPRRGLPLPPNPAFIAEIEALVPSVRVAIRAADFKCSVVDHLIGTNGISKPTFGFEEDALKQINATFALDQMKHPRVSFGNIQVVYRNMQVALNRSFETNPLIAPKLFVSNTDAIKDAKALAYTSEGGAFDSDDVLFEDIPVPANRIYICNSLMTRDRVHRIKTMIHELAHYVSGRPFFIDDQVKHGAMIDPPNLPFYTAITPEKKVRSAEHYAFFAVIAAGFKKLQ